jgi:hypothetical protein
MPSIIFDLGVLIGILYLGWLGSAHGIYASAVTALELFVSLSLAVLLYEPIAAFLAPILQDNLGVFLPDTVSMQSWTIFLVFALLMWGTMLTLWLVVHPKIVAAKEIKTIEAIDMAGGAVAAGFAGALFIGAAMVTWSMCPLLSFLRIPAQHMFLDVGKTALRTASGFAGERHEGRSLVLYGEPPSRESVGAARLASETWYDTDANTVLDDHDPFFDADANGTFTKDFYYEDVDGNRLRRIGLIEKYTVGRWDAQVLVANRDRPVKGPPKTAAKPAAAPPPQPAAAEPPPPPATQAAKKPKQSAAIDKASENEEEIVVLVDEDGNIISEEEMAEGDVEIVEEIVEEVIEEAGNAEKK